MNERFHSDDQVTSFGGQFYIVCPQCARCAIVVDRGAYRIVLSCRFCGYVRDETVVRTSKIGALVDWYFQIPLWLQTPCCGEILWAYNGQHLAFLEACVVAKQRTSVRNEYGWSNRGLMNRLPAWMKLAKNRDEVLHGLDKLQQKLADYLNESSP